MYATDVAEEALAEGISGVFRPDGACRRMLPMELEINGEPRKLPEGLTITALVTHLDIKTDRVAVELNQQIVPRGNWDTTMLKDGDHLEIVHFVGGGSPKNHS